MCLSIIVKLDSNEEVEIAVCKLLWMQEPELYRDGLCSKA